MHDPKLGAIENDSPRLKFRTYDLKKTINTHILVALKTSLLQTDIDENKGDCIRPTKTINTYIYYK